MHSALFTVVLATIASLVFTTPAAAAKCHRPAPLRNAGFENKLRLWVDNAAGGPDSNVKIIKHSYEGKYAASITCPTYNFNNDYVTLSQDIKMCGDRTYEVSFAYKAAVDTNAVLSVAAGTQADNRATDTFVRLGQSNYTGEWEQVSGRARTLPGYKEWFIEFYFGNYDTSAPSTIELDDIHVALVDD